MAKYAYVLMDADNTLLDFDGSEQDALLEIMKAYGYPIAEETFLVYHRVNRALWAAFEQGEISQEEVLSRRFQHFMEAVGGNHDPIAMNKAYMRMLAQRGSLLPGAEAFCRRLTNACTLAIVTNGIAEVQRERLNHTAIRKYFPHVFISAEIGYQKPSPEFFEVVCRELSIEDRSRAVIFGDSLSSDIQGGINAGIDTIWFNPKGLPLGTVRPTWEVESYETATSLILEQEE
jgi:2-haloacid dehalogenase